MEKERTTVEVYISTPNKLSQQELVTIAGRLRDLADKIEQLGNVLPFSSLQFRVAVDA